MKFAILVLLNVALCRGQDFAATAGQFLQNILPNLLSNQFKNQNVGPSATKPFGQIVPEAGGVEKKNYEDLLRQVQDQSSDDDLLRLSEELFNVDTNSVFNDIQVNLQGRTTPSSKNDEATFK